MCIDCYNNSKKDPEFPYITLATDPTWIIVSYDSQLFIKCSHIEEYIEEPIEEPINDYIEEQNEIYYEEQNEIYYEDEFLPILIY
jgi:hypothetical protein